METPTKSKKLGFLTATSLVVGNMVGSGIFLIPATLAFYGGISIYGWLMGGAGAIFLALVFSRLSRLVPESGGPYVYTREGFGDFAGFIVSWGYWISILCTNAAIAVAFVGYFAIFFPGVIASNFVSAATAIAVVWILTIVNGRGVIVGGRVQLITSILKIAPLILIAVVGLAYLQVDHFQPWNLSTDSNLDAVAATAALTFFAFMGVECATIPSEDIENANKTIPRATISGTIFVIILYLLSYVSLLGLIPPSSLQESTAPFADGGFKLFGNTGRYLVGLGAIFSTFGALNGWILLQGQVPYAIARDKLFPSIFAKLNSRKVPFAGLVISSIVITLLVASSYTRGLVGMFKFMILLTTVAVIFPYLFSSLAEVLILLKKKLNVKNYIKPVSVGAPAFLYLMWVLTGVGYQEVFYGIMLILSGIPFYVWIRYSAEKNSA